MSGPIVVLALTLHLANLFRPAQLPTPKVSCGIRTVSYRFQGLPGQELWYDGVSYRIPATGTVEILASPGVADYQTAGRMLPLNVWPLDDFGTRTVPLPSERSKP